MVWLLTTFLHSSCITLNVDSHFSFHPSPLRGFSQYTAFHLYLLSFATVLLAHADSLSLSVVDERETAGKRLRTSDEEVKEHQEHRIVHFLQRVVPQRSKRHVQSLPSQVDDVLSSKGKFGEPIKDLWGVEKRRFVTKKKARQYLTSPEFKKLYNELAKLDDASKDTNTVKALVQMFGASEVAQLLHLGQRRFKGTIGPRKESDIAYRLEQAQFQLWFDGNQETHTARVVEKKTGIELSETSRNGNAWVEGVLKNYREFFAKKIPETDPRHPG
ncbi:hypothetical protein PsorP6_007952 [Peronosclerospora sorghi]|uniref:Uncharacterized protein n=1 Tax=Peronosclerospora sorghi TaxID=230839 RepID=A0ACC0WDW8_9STRA|nr:hypothetical protein PsorP6_007952 [Peronosclerospora sorghi]